MLGVGLVASADLRRLQTPRGTALAWTEAAVFGDCRGYAKLSVRDPGEALDTDAQTDARTDTRTDTRTDEQRCRDLRRGSEDARLHSGTIGLDAIRVVQRGSSATVQIRLTRDRTARTALLFLVRKGSGWAVVRDTVACSQVGCA